MGAAGGYVARRSIGHVGDIFFDFGLTVVLRVDSGVTGRELCSIVRKPRIQ
jgi:hypothetical protein